MRILVVGFGRSGTSLLRRLIQAHPRVQKMYHETGLMGRANWKAILKRNHVSLSGSWGEKIPFYFRRPKKGGFGGTILDYCKEWNRRFTPDARIILIVRHPMDVAISAGKRWAKSTSKAMKKQKKLLPMVVGGVQKLPNSMIVKYEDLLLDTERSLAKIYKFCKLDPSYASKGFNEDRTRFGKGEKNLLKSHRVFAYKREDKLSGVRFKELLDLLNDIEGVDYEELEDIQSSEQTTKEKV